MVSEGFRSTEGKGRSYTPFTPTFTLKSPNLCFWIVGKTNMGRKHRLHKESLTQSQILLCPSSLSLFCLSPTLLLFCPSVFLPSWIPQWKPVSTCVFCTNLWTLWQSISPALLPTPLFVLLQTTKVTWDLQSPQHDSGIMRAGRRPVIDRDVCPLSLTSDLVYYHLSPSLCITTVYHPAPAAPRWQQKMNEWTLNASTSLFDK